MSWFWSRGRGRGRGETQLDQPDSQLADYGLALEEARRGFDRLDGEVNLIRTRAGSMLGMGGLAASFLGGLTLRDQGPLSGWTWVAVGAFVALAVLSVIVFLPRRLHMSQHPREIVSWADNDGATRAEMERDLALWLGTQYDSNRGRVDNLSRLLVAAYCAFFIEIAALILELLVSR